jgi:hypothetical protein
MPFCIKSKQELNGEAVACQGRKKGKTTNILLLTDRNGLVPDGLLDQEMHKE